MHCASCASIVERQLKKVPGVEQCSVSLTWEQAQVKGSPAALRPSALNPFLAKFGYALEDVATPQEVSLDYKALWLSASAIGTFFFMMMNTAWMTVVHQPIIPEIFSNWIFFLLACFNWTLTTSRFGKAILTFVRTRVANMDTLIGIGTTTALLSSALFLASARLGIAANIGLHMYADVTIVVIGFVYLGQFIEKRLRVQTTSALRTMQQRFAKTVTVETPQGIKEIAISDLKLGDVVQLGAGAVVPADGVILEGASALNEAALTGESLPVEKRAGDKVLAGTLNTSGTLRITVSALGNDTLYGKATESVLSASRAKANIERTADSLASVFVPMILCIALATFLGWLIFGARFVPQAQILELAISCTVAVLIVACPCALGLATPTAVSAALGKLSALGVFVRNPQSLELFGKVNTVVFDKTGTLTVGRPLVQHVETQNNSTAKEIITLAASIESGSQHPLATAIQLHAEERNIPTQAFVQTQTIQGKGIQARFEKDTYSVGSASWFREQGIPIQKPFGETHPEYSQILVAKGTQHLGTLYLQDELRPHMRETLSAMKALGIHCILLSGDSAATTAAIANQCGVTEWKSEYTPDEKALFVQQLQAKERTVLMIGDGINDTAALATASVSMAVSSGSDTALSVADATVFSATMAKLPEVLTLARFSMRIIHENLAWAFGYNSVFIPVAAGVLFPQFHLLLSPMIAGVLMSISSISVILNALRITRKSLSYNTSRNESL